MSEKQHTVRHAYLCPVCTSGKLDIPMWREDVEGWSYETIECPICLGKIWLEPKEWAAALDRLAPRQSNYPSDEAPRDNYWGLGL